jgi:hypothetical protein
MDLGHRGGGDYSGHAGGGIRQDQAVGYKLGNRRNASLVLYSRCEDERCVLPAQMGKLLLKFNHCGEGARQSGCDEAVITTRLAVAEAS